MAILVSLPFTTYHQHFTLWLSWICSLCRTSFQYFNNRYLRAPSHASIIQLEHFST